MDDQRPEDATKLAAFPRQSAMPCVCVADARQQMRTFLAETLEDLGCVTCECVHVAELSAELGTRPPDLVVIGSSVGGIEACEMVELLAAKEFGGKVLVLGPRASPMVAAIQELGAKLGLAMLPLLPTPFSQGDLRSSIAALLPIESPAKHPGGAADALRADSLELWYQAKIDTRTLALSGAEALAPMRHPTLGVVPPRYVMPENGDPHVGAMSELVIDRAIYFTARHGHIEIAINLPIAFFRDPELIEHLWRRIPDHPAFEGLIVRVNAAEVIRDLKLVRELARLIAVPRNRHLARRSRSRMAVAFGAWRFSLRRAQGRSPIRRRLCGRSPQTDDLPANHRSRRRPGRTRRCRWGGEPGRLSCRA